ncbi:MAG: hypothetical protein UV73_C0019G0004 [Candidatus Gottesmanbacteria bacterium GW2011_GWA2_43_14]|uniref:endo-1,4-beta-xylanase n=1 Tax=Candidatus Gottesmanbacteria bacterium GW2011_GWA2_43_14 TaxID=1618443 RepID=A0A0G1DCI2_9BACT|nr:MAG: hypothetical protein UV73_C0019G0004 [Candidatus Gottesmanbacteria bacterium GW2011_GWA2_43_14]
MPAVKPEIYPNQSDDTSVQRNPLSRLELFDISKAGAEAGTLLFVLSKLKIPVLDTMTPEQLSFLGTISAVNPDIDTIKTSLEKKSDGKLTGRALLSFTATKTRLMKGVDLPDGSRMSLTMRFSHPDPEQAIRNAHRFKGLTKSVIYLKKASEALLVGSAASAVAILHNADPDKPTIDESEAINRYGRPAKIALAMLGGLIAGTAAGCVSTTPEDSQSQEGLATLTPMFSDGTPYPVSTPLPPADTGGYVLEAGVETSVELFQAAPITVGYLVNNGEKLDISLTTGQSNLGPQPIMVPPTSDERHYNPVEYAEKTFGNTIRSDNGGVAFKNPIKMLEYAVAQAAAQAQENVVGQAIHFRQKEDRAFGNLTFYREQLKIDDKEHKLTNAHPTYLVVRDGSGITVVGKGNNGDIVVAFEEYVSRDSDEFFEPRMRFAILSQGEFAVLNRDHLNNMEYRYNPADPSDVISDKLLFNDNGIKRTVQLNRIDDEMMGMIRAETYEVWVDSVPAEVLNGETTKSSLHPNPLVRKPDVEKDLGLPSGFRPDITDFNYSVHYNNIELNNPKNSIVFAEDKNSDTVLVARFNGREWEWKSSGMRDYADALSIRNGTKITYELFDGTQSHGLSDSIKEKYRKTVANYCNMAVIDDALSWSGLEPSNGEIDQGSDWYIKYQIDELQKLGINRIRGHAVIYPKEAPPWLRGMDKNQLEEQIRKRVKQMVQSYKCNEWVMVNEPYRHYSGDDDLFHTQLGEEYIDLAFEEARRIDSNARLIFNDVLNHTTLSTPHSIFGVPQNLQTDTTLKIVNRLKQKGLIDAVGIQMHLDGANPPDWNNVIETLKSYGITVEITEFDVDMRNAGGSPEEKDQKQADIFQAALDAMISSGVCTGFSVWGIGDNSGTTFNENLDPKPAYHAMENSFKSHLDLS